MLANKPQVSRVVAGRQRRRAVAVRATSAVVSSNDIMQLGKSELKVPLVGVGAWSWGDRSGYWGYGTEYGREESKRAYKALMGAGLTFIDTAEVYGFGKSEEFLGEFMREEAALGKPIIATKFAPLPWRFTPDSVVVAAKESLGRMGLPSMDLYMIHWPGFLVNAFSNDAYLEGLVRVKQAGLATALGVSNFNKDRTRAAARKLEAAGYCLASNQVQYSLLYRTPERNGVLEACREYGVTLVAYSPLCQGLLTGKYKVSGSKPSGPRAALFTDDRIRQVQPVLSAMQAVAAERSKTLAQIALNYCITKGTLPIPGAKNERQLEEIAGALGWRLSEGEVLELEKAADKVPTSLGAPFENW